MSGRICILRHNFFPAEAHLRKNVEALQEAGFEVDVVCLREQGVPAESAFGRGVVTRLPITHRRAGKMRYVFEYAAFLVLASALMAWRSLRRPYDVVEVYNIPDVLAFAALPAKLRGSRLVLYLFELMPEQVRDEYGLTDHHPLVRFLRWTERRSVRLADRVVCVSPYDANLVSARSAPRREPLVILNVPDERLFTPIAPAAPTTGRPLRLVTHGSILRRYGIETLIQAIPFIRKEVPQVEVWIIGEGEHRAQLQKMAATLRVGESVRFLPWHPIEDIPGLLSETDIGVVPAAVPWLLPNKLFEYVAMQKPVVACDSPSLRSVFPNGEVDYFRPGDPEDLAQRVIELSRNRRLRKQRVERASAVILPQRWEVSKQAYTAMHHELMAARK